MYIEDYRIADDGGQIWEETQERVVNLGQQDLSYNSRSYQSLVLGFVAAVGGLIFLILLLDLVFFGSSLIEAIVAGK